MIPILLANHLPEFELQQRIDKESVSNILSGRLSFKFLPAYSPELNSVERVWKLTRRLCTHNRYFPALEELVAAVFDQFQVWTTPNHTLQKLCAVI